jgi:excisionase family DNA binding protein
MMRSKLSFESNLNSLFFEKQRLLTVKDVAEFLQCSLQHIYNLVWRREIPFVKIGGLLRFRKEELIEWLHRKEL